MEGLKRALILIFLFQKSKNAVQLQHILRRFLYSWNLAKQNIEYFESFFDQIDAMIIPEATCSAMIKAWLGSIF